MSASTAWAQASSDIQQQAPLPCGVFTFPNNTLPGGTTYEGSGLCTVIKAARPDTDWMLIGPGAVLKNLAIWDAFGMDRAAMRGKPNGPRLITYLENAHDFPMVSTHWSQQTRYVSCGAWGVDSPCDVTRNVGYWSAAHYVESYEEAIGFHAWSFNAAKGILAQHFDNSTAIWVMAEPGAVPPFGSLTFTPKANVRSIHVEPWTDTGTDLQFSSMFKTGGAFVSLYHHTSSFAGALLSARMADGSGSFTGSIVDVTNAGRRVFLVTSDGDVVEGKLAERIAALEAAVAALRAAQTGVR